MISTQHLSFIANMSREWLVDYFRCVKSRSARSCRCSTRQNMAQASGMSYTVQMKKYTQLLLWRMTCEVDFVVLSVITCNTRIKVSNTMYRRQYIKSWSLVKVPHFKWDYFCAVHCDWRPIAIVFLQQSFQSRVEIHHRNICRFPGKYARATYCDVMNITCKIEAHNSSSYNCESLQFASI